ncbi:MAG: M20/M25/M40 family metallo-hydrolase [Chloroflexi bacterium]|nr:M20/M25/M40 family metallo-hydrolase [Chloroflexota bacterium]
MTAPSSAHRATFERLDRGFDDLVDQTQRFVRQTSNSLTDDLNPEVFRCADMLELYLRRLGCERVEQCHFDQGYPVVYAEMRSSRPEAKWLLISCLYDVVPWDEDDWVVDPVGAEVHDAAKVKLPAEWGPVLTGRGTRNQKGPLMCVLQALRALRDVEGDLPLNIMLALEGEEEIASPHLREFRDRYLPELSRASAAYLANPIEDAHGNQMLFLGLRGIIGLELTVRGGDWGGPRETGLFATDVAWVDHPAWRLVWALGTLQDPSGKVLIDGFYDGARPWTAEERTYFEAARAQFDEEATKRMLGISKFRCGMPGVDGYEVLMSEPLLNIDGLVSGYTGPKVKTSFPKSATAKIDIRLVPGLDWQEMVAKLRRHLDRHGFPEVQIEVQNGYNTCQTPVDSPIVQAALRTAADHGPDSIIWPVYFASNPMVTWNEPPLSLPIVSAGVGKMGRPHMANEYFTLSGMREYPKWVVSFLKNFAEANDAIA